MGVSVPQRIPASPAPGWTDCLSPCKYTLATLAFAITSFPQYCVLWGLVSALTPPPPVFSPPVQLYFLFILCVDYISSLVYVFLSITLSCCSYPTSFQMASRQGRRGGMCLHRSLNQFGQKYYTCFQNWASLVSGIGPTG